MFQGVTTTTAVGCMSYGVELVGFGVRGLPFGLLGLGDACNL